MLVRTHSWKMAVPNGGACFATLTRWSPASNKVSLVLRLRFSESYSSLRRISSSPINAAILRTVQAAKSGSAGQNSSGVVANAAIRRLVMKFPA